MRGQGPSSRPTRCFGLILVDSTVQNMNFPVFARNVHPCSGWESRQLKIVPDIWIWSKVQFPFLGKLHFTSYPDVGYNFSADAILFQSRGVNSVQRLEKLFIRHHKFAKCSLKSGESISEERAGQIPILYNIVNWEFSIGK